MDTPVPLALHRAKGAYFSDYRNQGGWLLGGADCCGCGVACGIPGGFACGAAGDAPACACVGAG